MRGPVGERPQAAGSAPSTPQAEPAPASASAIRPQPLTPLARRVVLLLAGAAVVYLLLRLRGIVTLVVISGLLAYVLAPVVDLLTRLVFRTTGRPLPRWASILLVFVASGLLLGAAGVVVVPPLVEEMAALVRQLPEYYEQVAAIAADIRRMSRTQLPEAWRQTAETYLGQAASVALRFVTGSLGALWTLVASLVGVVLVPILTFFMLKASPGVRGGVLSWFAPRYRPEVDFLLADINLVMLKFLRGRLIVAAVIAALVAAGTWALGVPYPLVLGLVAGLLDLIPFIGPILAAIPAVVLALLDDPTRALWVVALYVGVQQLEQLVLSPRIEGGELKLNPAVVILAATAAGSLFGFLGVLLAIPLTALARIGLLYLRAKLLGDPLRSLADEEEA